MMVEVSQQELEAMCQRRRLSPFVPMACPPVPPRAQRGGVRYRAEYLGDTTGAAWTGSYRMFKARLQGWARQLVARFRGEGVGDDRTVHELYPMGEFDGPRKTSREPHKALVVAGYLKVTGGGKYTRYHLTQAAIDLGARK